MESEFETRLKGIDQASLMPFVRRTLDNETIEISDWHSQRIHGGMGDVGTGLSGVYRFSGNGHDQDEVLLWSLILKVIHAPEDGDYTPDLKHWKLEPLAYQSGLLDDLPGGLRAPRCFGVVEQPGDEFWIWLEDIVDQSDPVWPLEHYGVVARHLGQFNGAYLAGRRLPSHAWLSTGWLRAWVAQAAPGIAQLPSAREHPLGRCLYPDDIADGFLRLWKEREMFLGAHDHLPQTFCHLDAFRRNLFARRTADGNDQTVAIDWADVGVGAIGEEIAPLVAASLGFYEVELTKAQELDEIVYEGYLEGLRDAGWRGDPRLVRFGYTTTSCLRYGIGAMSRLDILFDESQHAWIEQVLGRPIEEAVDYLAELYRFLLDLADEARELLGSIS